METLAQRELTYDDNGASGRVLLTVFQPSESDRGVWKGRFAVGPPIQTNAIAVAGIDYIQAILGSLQVACGYLRGSKLRGRVQWHGVENFGLPWPSESYAALPSDELPPMEENPGGLRVLATRALGYPDDHGVEIEIPLTVFVPFDTGSGSWKCGVALGATEGLSIRYGVGVDYIEALLHALAIARAAFDEIAGHRVLIDESLDLLDCTGFPVKAGRAFWLDPSNDALQSQHSPKV